MTRRVRAPALLYMDIIVCVCTINLATELPFLTMDGEEFSWNFSWIHLNIFLHLSQKEMKIPKIDALYLLNLSLIKLNRIENYKSCKNINSDSFMVQKFGRIAIPNMNY